MATLPATSTFPGFRAADSARILLDHLPGADPQLADAVTQTHDQLEEWTEERSSNHYTVKRTGDVVMARLVAIAALNKLAFTLPDGETITVYTVEHGTMVLIGLIHDIDGDTTTEVYLDEDTARQRWQALQDWDRYYETTYDPRGFIDAEK